MLELNRNDMGAINMDIKTNTNAFELGIKSIVVCMFEARNLFTVVVLLHRIIYYSKLQVRIFREAITCSYIHTNTAVRPILIVFIFHA